MLSTTPQRIDQCCTDVICYGTAAASSFVIGAAAGFGMMVFLMRNIDTTSSAIITFGVIGCYAASNCYLYQSRNRNNFFSNNQNESDNNASTAPVATAV